MRLLVDVSRQNYTEYSQYTPVGNPYYQTSSSSQVSCQNKFLLRYWSMSTKTPSHIACLSIVDLDRPFEELISFSRN